MSGPGDPVADLVREADFGRYAATLFAPAQARPHLFALYAYDIELARVRDLVSEPMPGEIRLQWWRDAIENPERADVVAHPVARALEGAIAYGGLPRAALVGLSEARIDDLYDDPVPTVADLEARLGATHSAVLRLSCLIVAAGRDPGGAEVCGFGGVAQGIARLLRSTARLAARGQSLIPVKTLAAAKASREDLFAGRSSAELSRAAQDLAAHGLRRLQEARSAYGELDPQAAAAILPLALVGPELERLARADDPLSPVSEAARWRLLWRLWRMSRRTPPF